jgi:hypothetical protein
MADDRTRRIQELRRSSAASPRPSGKAYKRREKYTKQDRP